MVLPLGDSSRTRIVPVATYLLIAANVVMYLVQLAGGSGFTTAYAATPFEITNDEDIAQPFELMVPVEISNAGSREVRVSTRRIEQGPVPFPVWFTLITSMFLHGSPIHLAGNMLFLWIFGDDVEEVLGAVRYVLAYLACGLVGTLAQLAFDPESYLPILGASGAIAGVMGAYLIWFPSNRVRVLFFQVILEIPAWVVIGTWIGFQIWNGLGSIGLLGRVGGVAYLAHVGGVVAGIAVALLFRDRARAARQLEWDPPWGD